MRIARGLRHEAHHLACSLIEQTTRHSGRQPNFSGFRCRKPSTGRPACPHTPRHSGSASGARCETTRGSKLGNTCTRHDVRFSHERQSFPPPRSRPVGRDACGCRWRGSKAAGGSRGWVIALQKQNHNQFCTSQEQNHHPHLRIRLPPPERPKHGLDYQQNCQP